MLTSSKIKILDIESELRKRGINTALEQAEDTRFFKTFRSDLRKGLFDQIEFIAKNNGKMKRLVSLVKLSVKDLTLSFLARKSIAKSVDFKSFLIWAGQRGGQATLDELKIEGTFTLTNPDIVNFFDDHSKLLIDSVDDFTAQWIALKIKTGKKEGLTTMEIAQTLIDEGKGISKVRAQRIAMNELVNAMTIVELETATRMGIEEKIWRTSIDDRVCPICIPLEGVKVDINKDFSTSEGPVQGPPAHVGCRCFLEEVIPSKWEIPDNIWLGS